MDRQHRQGGGSVHQLSRDAPLGQAVDDVQDPMHGRTHSFRPAWREVCRRPAQPSSSGWCRSVRTHRPDPFRANFGGGAAASLTACSSAAIFAGMRALFCHDNCYIDSPDGEIYSVGQFAYPSWQRYLAHFDELVVLGRGRSLAAGEDVLRLNRASGARVSFVTLPNINSLRGMLTRRAEVVRRVASEVERVDAVIVRGASELGMIAARQARKLGRPVALEMSGCAFDHAWHYGTLHGRLYAPVKYLRARTLARHADFVIYVSREFLQRRYPTRGRAEAASNVEIDPARPDVLEARLRRIARPPGLLTLGLIGAVDHNLKGIGTALAALGLARAELPEFRFRVLGKGDPQRWSSEIARAGLAARVEFCGTLPSGEPVLRWLDEIDVYLQPSFHEGVPRALIEAMSRGCLGLGSTAGGIPELLEPECLHRRGDATALASLLVRAGRDAPWRRGQARRNFALAHMYDRDHLVPRRTCFWREFAAYVQARADE
jgi:glycosyltransferase involved in cell wall biosynthesis